jgi:hypothetical protein
MKEIVMKMECSSRPAARAAHEFSRAFQRTVAEGRRFFVASATIDSIVADATPGQHALFPALKRRAKFKTPLARLNRKTLYFSSSPERVTSNADADDSVCLSRRRP